MVIVGPKPFIYEEPKVVEEKWKHGFFNLRKTKAATQNFSSTVIKASDQGDTTEELKSRIFNFDQIKAATLDFNPVNQIGKGCAGTVYKGVLPDGKVIATAILLLLLLLLLPLSSSIAVASSHSSSSTTCSFFWVSKQSLLMSMDRQFITDWSLNLYPVESMELNDPEFEESGSITFRLLQHRQIVEISMDEEDTFDILDNYTTFSSEFLAIKLSLLCSDQQVTDDSVETILRHMEVHPLLIDRVKNRIVSDAVQMGIDTKNRGLKKFGLMADIEVTTATEVAPESEEIYLIEEELRFVLLQSMMMRETNSIKNPASKSSIEKLKRGFFEGGGEVGDDGLVIKKNCAVCLDDFEIGSEVIWMPCSHMFHGGCLDRWFEESNSCPLCRLELTD